MVERGEKKMTSENIERILANAKATLAVEGLKPSKIAVEITRIYLAGEITSEQAISLIKKLYRL